MVTIKNKYVLKEYDKILTLSIVDELCNESDDVDVIIYTDNKDTCLKMLVDVCNIDGIIPISFIDLCDVFHNSGKWYYKEYTCTLNEINNSNLYTNYDNIKACFIVFKIGKNIDLHNLEDILENIRQNREEVEITFGCILDETFESDRIDMFIYKR